MKMSRIWFLLRVVRFVFSSKQLLITNGKEEGIYVDGHVALTIEEQGTVTAIQINKTALIRPARKGQSSAIMVIGFEEVVKAVIESKQKRKKVC